MELAVFLLLCAVILVNGWTDAPNAITTPVASGVLPFPAAAALAAVCNVAGVLLFAQSGAVSRTLTELTALGGRPLPVLAAALAATALWGGAAWWFGIPTSESHALLAGLAGGALALGENALQTEVLLKVILGLALSLLLGGALGRLTLRLLPPLHPALCRRGQVLGAALTALLHGAQDGQKFLGLLALILFPAHPRQPLPGSLLFLCGGLMGLGTLLGGRRIIDTVGRKMVRLTPRAALSADLGSAAALTLCTLWGLPVSTTHVKTAAIRGAGESPDRQVTRKLGAAWLLTFPACGILSFCLVKLFLLW